ncbi:MAG: hypothetical protein QXJ72_07630 [Thermoproteota archaeon]
MRRLNRNSHTKIMMISILTCLLATAISIGVCATPWVESYARDRVSAYGSCGYASAYVWNYSNGTHFISIGGASFGEPTNNPPYSYGSLKENYYCGEPNNYNYYYHYAEISCNIYNGQYIDKMYAKAWIYPQSGDGTYAHPEGYKYAKYHY